CSSDLHRVSPNLVDEVMYRSVTIGFPLFTLGGLIFASIWAQIAWDRFWGWDPKEVWAHVTWFFYAAFLHLRLSRGWHGEKSAWLDRKSTRLNSSHVSISYAVFCLNKKI